MPPAAPVPPRSTPGNPPTRPSPRGTACAPRMSCASTRTPRRPSRPGWPARSRGRSTRASTSTPTASTQSSPPPPPPPPPPGRAGGPGALGGPFAPSLNESPDSEYAELTAAAAAYTGVDPGEIVVGAGADEVLDIIAKTFLPAAGAAIVPIPTYGMYGVLTSQRAARAIAVPRRGTDGAFGLDLDRLLPLQAEAQVVWLAVPNNPTGADEPEANLLALLDAAAALGPKAPAIVVDEAYHEFTGRTAIPLRDRYPHLIVVRTLSKAFALPGIRIGYAVAARATIARLERVRPPGSVSTVSATIGAGGAAGAGGAGAGGGGGGGGRGGSGSRGGRPARRPPPPSTASARPTCAPAWASTTTCGPRSPTTPWWTSPWPRPATSRWTSTTRSRTSPSSWAVPSRRRSATAPVSAASATRPCPWTRRSRAPSWTAPGGRTPCSTWPSAASGSAPSRRSSSSTPSRRSRARPA